MVEQTLKQKNMRHLFLTEDNLQLIKEKVDKKKKNAEKEIALLKEITEPTEGERFSGDDGGSQQSVALEKSLSANALTNAKNTVDMCETVLFQLKNQPETYGFDKEGKPLPVNLLLFNPLAKEIPEGYKPTN